METQRGKPKLEHDGHLYVSAGMSKDCSKEFWRCQFKSSKPKCLARLHRTVASGEITVSGVHSDMPNAAAVEVLRMKTSIKRRAADTAEPPQHIISRIRTTSSIAAQGRLEKDKTLARLAQRTRNRLGIPSANYIDRTGIVLPPEFTTYESSPGNFESFVLGDSGEDDVDRVLIFGRASAESWIADVSKIYVDGTFSLAPALFSQVFVILGERPGCVVPLCYALLPNKTEASYSKVS